MVPFFLLHAASAAVFPTIVATWFAPTVDKAWEVLSGGGSAVDAVVAGCSRCEELQCNGTVGKGSSPDEQGETTLDGMVMDGNTLHAGAVAGLRRIKNAIGVARAVMDYTVHTLLVGDLATQFAKEMGFPEEDLHTTEGRGRHQNWVDNNCQPNYRVNVLPDPTQSCGPYQPLSAPDRHFDPTTLPSHASAGSHDTVAAVVMDRDANFACGTSTAGAFGKVPGRVGDSPIVGAGAYADSDIGGCGGTGDGDIMMRFAACFDVVQSMAQGLSPAAACEKTLRKIARKYPNFTGSLVAVNKQGDFGASGYGWKSSYAVRRADMNETKIFNIVPFKNLI